MLDLEAVVLRREGPATSALLLSEVRVGARGEMPCPQWQPSSVFHAPSRPA